MKRTPSQGLKILEQLHNKNPYNQNIQNHLIGVYFNLGFQEKALSLINNIPENTENIHFLRYKALGYFIQNNKDKELECWSKIFNKTLDCISTEHREYLLNQAPNNKLALYKEQWLSIFKLAFDSIPIGIQENLGNQINNVILIANNPNITLEILQENISPNDLLVCFNYSIIFQYHEYFNDNPKLFFFRRRVSNGDFYGLPNSVIDYSVYGNTDSEKFYELTLQDNSYLMFNEHLPKIDTVEKSLYQKICNPYYSSVLSVCNIITRYYPKTEHYFYQSITEPTSGFVIYQYFYYCLLHLQQSYAKTFNITLIGFNLNKGDIYPQVDVVHSWQYERERMKHLPKGVRRIIV